MFLFSKLAPTLVVDGKNLEKQIDSLLNLRTILNVQGQNEIDNDIKFMKIGLAGEGKILYELLNSNIPMYIFHDVYYEFEDTSAQIDFIIVTDYKIFVLECKNIIGNVIINSDGNFIREYNGKKEGMYSPVTQNNRHIDIINNLLYSRQNALRKLFYNKSIRQNIESVVVFTNPKTIIKKNYAPKNIKKCILRADEINAYIKNVIKTCEFKNLDKESFANFFEFHNKSREIVISKKYDKYIVTTKKVDINREDLEKELVSYRHKKAQEDNIKAYYIFTNEQMVDIIKLLPRTKDELSEINGFGDFKINKYGDDIIAIVKRY